MGQQKSLFSQILRGYVRFTYMHNNNIRIEKNIRNSITEYWVYQANIFSIDLYSSVQAMVT